MDVDSESSPIIDAFIRLLRFIAVLNGGGVAVTISAIGATAQNGKIENCLALPLGFFTLGLITILLYCISNFFQAVSKSKKLGPIVGLPTWVTSNWFQVLTGWLAVICFALGCASSVLVVAIA
tara:strand:- start:129 stop:497 length:369 start_codon:yes stop_codon:yes gene_type:complete